MEFFESFEGSTRTRQTRRSLGREADLFYEALTGAPRPARSVPVLPPAAMPPAEARAPLPVDWDDVDTLVETVPTFAVGAPEIVGPTTGFVEMPAHLEAWVPNAEGRGIVIADFVCRTQAQLDATLPFVPVHTPRPLWRDNPLTGRLEALLEALVYYPATVAGGTDLPAGRHPLAIICHGNHGVVRDDGTEILSLRGYSGFTGAAPAVPGPPYLQEALAGRGIISASVNMNPANLLNMLIETRALLAIAILRLMQLFDRTADSRYYRKIDFQRVALIGHSRGGDAVARAMRLLPSNTRGSALVQLAPTDSTGILQGTAPRPVTLPIPPGVPPPPATLPIPPGLPLPAFVRRPSTIPATGSPHQLIIWGSRDGDVSGVQDVRTDVSVNPFRHYDRSAVERAFQFWHGATHNRFNRLWTDAEEDTLCKSCITTDPSPNAAATLLSRPNQEARTVEMVLAWLFFALYDDTAEAGLLDGRTRTAIDPTRPIAGMWKFGARLVTIDQFDDVQPALNTLGGANVTPPTGVFDEITLANENGAGAGVTAYQFPHIDRALRYSPAPVPTARARVLGIPPPAVATPVWRTTIPAGSAARDFRRFDVLTFRVTKKYDPTRLLGAIQPTRCFTPPPPPPPTPPGHPPAPPAPTCPPLPPPPAPPPPLVELPRVRVRLIGSNPAHSHTEAAAGRLSSRPIVRRIDTGPQCDCVLDLTKVHYETWEADLAPYRAAMGTGFSDVAFVELEISTEVGQPVYVDTLSLVKRP